GNLFVGAPRGVYGPEAALVPASAPSPETFGTHAYDGAPASWEEYERRVWGPGGTGDHARFHHEQQPAYVWSNVYADGARPVAHERDALVVAEPASARVVEEGDAVYLELDLPAALTAAVAPVITGADLGRVRIAAAAFDNPDGTPLVADVDLVGER